MSATITLIENDVQNSSIKSLAILLAIVLTACSPKFDWREVRGSDAPFTVLMPAKPATFSREMQLNDVMLKMQMTAADAEGVSFAVGSAKVDDAGKIPGVLQAMQKGMLNNIHGNIDGKVVRDSNPANKDLIAYGTLQNGQPVKLVARFVSRGAWVYQAVIIGKEKALTPEVVDTFMTSFKIN
ncbi:MAG: hypothetical protein Q7U12_05540 [Undibacterium sp.]|nr:hypothetical protein [Undibacterium sp.]